MNDLIEGARTEGEVLIDDTDILDPRTDLVVLRKKVGMVFQRPNPFPLSIYENIVFGEKIHADRLTRDKLDEIVERSLGDVLLWDELKDQLNEPAMRLSLEQKQRLCIARLIAVKPDVLLMDEPCSTLDPQATARVEELMRELKNRYTIIIVTHNMQQAARVSDDTGFMLLGELIEFGKTHGRLHYRKVWIKISRFVITPKFSTIVSAYSRDFAKQKIFVLKEVRNGKTCRPGTKRTE